MTTSIRAYRQPVSRYWWAKRRSYLLFMLREISCVFVAWSVVYLLLLVHAIAREDSYARFLDWSANPLVVSVNVVAFIFLLLHAVTWFNLAPRAIVPHVRGRAFLLARCLRGTTRRGSSYRRSSRGWSCHDHTDAASSVS